MKLMELKEALAADKDKAEKFEQTLAGDVCRACGSDAEALSLAARSAGFEVSPEEIERAMAEAQELDEKELEKVGGGRTSSDDEDEYGHDVWCWVGWHCYTVTLHTQTESKRASCWSNYDCVLVNIK
jgi:predicted ribosomally synthesized peptide with nif11-like leader